MAPESNESALAPADPTTLPPFYAEERAAWSGKYPSGLKMRVEAAATGGRLRWLRVWSPELGDPEIEEDFDTPHAMFKELRRRCPVAHSDAMGGFWAVTKYDDIVRVLTDWQTFTTRIQNVVPRVATTQRRPPLHLDPPHNTPYRTAITRLLTPKKLAPWRERIESMVDELLTDRPNPSKAEIVMLTSDRGLAGSFNAQLIRQVESFVDDELAEYSEVSLRIVGRKGNDYFKRRDANICGYVEAPTSADAVRKSRELANFVIEDYLDKKVDRVFLIYNEFKSAITQNVVAKQLLPIIPEESDDEPEGDFLYEPSQEELLEHLVPLYVQIGIYRATLESIASEFGARMSAMDSATRNAGEMIDKLTLQYNRARQAAITTELLEIIAGAESLKG